MRNIKFIYGLGPVDRLSGILDGDFNFILGADGKIQRADTHLLLRESSILPTKGGMIIPLDGIEFIAKLDGYSLEIERLAMDALSYGQLAVRGKLTMDNQLYPSVLEAQLQAEALDNLMVLNLWPDALFPRTQSWLRKHVEGGQVSTFFLNIGLDLKAERIKPLFVEGQGVATASRFHYMSSHDPVTDAEFALRFEGTNLAGTTFELIFNEGSLNGIRSGR